MPPRPFYEINDSKTYLFGKSLETSETNNKRKKMPEEKVRQWALFELLSTYGYHINDIKIEVPSKMGSGYHPADIVIYKDHQPYIVIECKKIGSNEQDEAIKQMITYATGLKTQFAVYTDGETWLVKRLLTGQWIDVYDIPRNSNLAGGSNLSGVFWLITHIRPLLYWTYKSVPASNAPKYFFCLENFIFSEGFTYLREINRNLLYGTNHIIKTLCQRNEKGNVGYTIDEYQNKNLLIAASYYLKYLGDINVGGYLIENFDFENRSYEEAINDIEVELTTVVMNYPNVINKETVFLRFSVSILRYIQDVLKNSLYVNIESTTTKDLYSLINLILITEFGLELPDSMDIDSVRDLEALSSESWLINN